MQIIIKATNMELTPAIQGHIEEKVGSLKKFIHLSGPGVQARVEVGITTKHHQSGDIFRAEIQIRLPHIEKNIRTESEQNDLYIAIDDARDQMKRELRGTKEKRETLIRRGARMFKRLIPFFGE